MHTQLVIYVDKSVENFVRWYRRDKRDITRIVVTSIEELEYYKYHDTVREIMNSEEFITDHEILHHPEGFSPEYNILMNNKLSMLRQATVKNYFKSTHFFWIDMGYGHSFDIFPSDCTWAPHNLMYNETVSDKITYIQLNPVEWLNSIYELYKKDIPPFLNGGFFGGSIKAVQRYWEVHGEIFKLFLSYNMIDDDQTLAVASYFRDRKLFNLVDGWWYDAFKLFY